MKEASLQWAPALLCWTLWVLREWMDVLQVSQKNVVDSERKIVVGVEAVWKKKWSDEVSVSETRIPDTQSWDSSFWLRWRGFLLHDIHGGVVFFPRSSLFFSFGFSFLRNMMVDYWCLMDCQMNWMRAKQVRMEASLILDRRVAWLVPLVYLFLFRDTYLARVPHEWDLFMSFNIYTL